MRCTVCRRLIPDESKKCPCCGSDFQDGWSTRDARRARNDAAVGDCDGGGVVLRMRRRRPSPVSSGNDGVESSAAAATETDAGSTETSSTSSDGAFSNREGTGGVRRRRSTQASKHGRKVSEARGSAVDSLAIIGSDNGIANGSDSTGNGGGGDGDRRQGGQANFKPRFDEADSPISMDDDGQPGMSRQEAEWLDELKYQEMSDAEMEEAYMAAAELHAARMQMRDLGEQRTDIEERRDTGDLDSLPVSTKLLALSAFIIAGGLVGVFLFRTPDLGVILASATLGFIIGFCTLFPKIAFRRWRRFYGF